jgi:hypothetical protein
LYTVVDDITTVYAAVITGMVTDEILGDFSSPDFTVEVSRNDLASKTTERGLYAVATYPDVAFPLLNSQSYPISWVLQAPGFRDFPLSVTIPQNAVFPVPAPVAAMRRLPVRIQGRVVKDATRQPIGGALVVAVDNPNPPSPPPPPPLPHTTLMRSALYFDHPVNTKVQQVNLTNVGNAKLTQPAPAGTQVLNLTTTAGLVGSAFIQLATPSLTSVEYGVVDHLGSAPGQVFLRNALNRSYGDGAATNVQFVTAAPAGGAASAMIDANAGDGIIVADSLLNVSTVVVDAASATKIEYHEVGAISGSDGYYALDGMGRVQQLFLQANPPGTPVVPWFIVYDQPVNVVDFRL